MIPTKSSKTAGGVDRRQGWMRQAGLEDAIEAAGGIGALARALGISQPAVSNWQKIPAERVLAVEAITGVARTVLRPDLYPKDQSSMTGEGEIDEVDVLRSHEYNLLALLLGRAPTREVLEQLSHLQGDASPLGMAHIALAEAAAAADPDAVQREFFDLFVGVSRGELLPYGSYYLTGFVYERPLASVRQDLAALGIELSEAMREPEDHIAILCEVMAGLAVRQFEAEPGAQRRFFERHLKPWTARFFSDLETSKASQFYKPVGRIGSLFMTIEAEAFAMDA
jgi:TorA maturation chaperone TorD